MWDMRTHIRMTAPMTLADRMSAKPTWELKKIVDALSKLPFFNTEEDNERLEAAKKELARRKH